MSIVKNMRDNGINEIPSIYSNITQKIDAFENDLKIDGKNLQSAVAEQSSLLVYYDHVSCEAQTLLNYVDMLLKKIKAERIQHIKKQSQIDYTDSMLQKIVESDKEYIKHNEYFLEVKELAEKCKSIVSAFEQRGYSLNNLVKIREHELEHVIIRIEND